MTPSRWQRLKRDPRGRAALLMLVGLVLGLGAGRVLFAPAGGPFVDEAALDELRACQNRGRVQEREMRQQREEIAYLKQSVIVEQEACFGVRDMLGEKEAEIGKLHEQLAFYRGIVTPEESETGVRVHKFELQNAGGTAYQFRVTLLQPVRVASAAEGRLQLKLEGLVGDQTQTRDIQALAPKGSFKPEYEFRYFTEVFGQFRLPRDFVPLRLGLYIQPKGFKSPRLATTYLWSELVNPAGEANASKP